MEGERRRGGGGATILLWLIWHLCTLSVSEVGGMRGRSPPLSYCSLAGIYWGHMCMYSCTTVSILLLASGS